MDIDPSWAKVWTDWAQWALGVLGAAAILVWTMMRRRHEEVARDVRSIDALLHERQAAMGQRIGTVEQAIARCDAAGCAMMPPRMSRLEEAIERMPSHDDLARAHSRIDQVANSMSRVEGHVTGISATVARIEAHLLEHGPRAGDR